LFMSGILLLATKTHFPIACALGHTQPTGFGRGGHHPVTYRLASRDQQQQPSPTA
jgi:hypothetical protein